MFSIIIFYIPKTKSLFNKICSYTIHMEAISQKANCYLKDISTEVNLTLTGWWM